MSDEAPVCARCDRPMRHDTAIVCAPCARQLAVKLELVGKIAGDITLTVAKLGRVTRGGSGQVDDLGWWKHPEALEPVPLPVDLEAGARHDAAVNALSTWARVIAEERGKPARPWVGHVARPPARLHPLAELVGVLAENLEWLRHHPAADEAWLDLLTACGQLERVVDTYDHDRPIIGLCSCGTARHDGEARCLRCGETDIATSRADIEHATHGHPVTASQAAVWIADMGLVADTGKLRKLIWAWSARGHIEAVDETPRYRFGDVLRRVLDSPALLRAA